MLIIDRFEDDYAVCEKDGASLVRIARCYLPAGVYEGCVLVEKNGAYSIDAGLSRSRKTEAENKIDKLLKDFDFTSDDNPDKAD